MIVIHEGIYIYQIVPILDNVGFIVIPIVIITLVVIIMQKKRIKIQTKKDSE